jgi:hypothetical protein
MGRNSVIPIALRTIDRVIGALFLLTIAIGPAAAANCDIFSCVTHHDAVPNFTTDDGIGKFDPRQYGTSRLVIDGQVSITGALSAADTVTMRVVK